MTERLRARVVEAETAFEGWASEHGVALLRVVLGAVFAWVGLARYLPALSDAEVVAARTVQGLMLGFAAAHVCVRMVGAIEPKARALRLAQVRSL